MRALLHIGGGAAAQALLSSVIRAEKNLLGTVRHELDEAHDGVVDLETR